MALDASLNVGPGRVVFERQVDRLFRPAVFDVLEDMLHRAQGLTPQQRSVVHFKLWELHASFYDQGGLHFLGLFGDFDRLALFVSPQADTS